MDPRFWDILSGEIFYVPEALPPDLYLVIFGLWIRFRTSDFWAHTQ